MQFGQVLMTVAIAQYGVIPVIADFNRSHALNPAWPPHARFHVVEQVLPISSVPVFAAGLLWWPGLDVRLRADLAALASVSVLAAFFGGFVAGRFVGGAPTALGPPGSGALMATSSTSALRPSCWWSGGS